MLGFGWGEILVIAVVVLIVVGPKDLPVMLRNLGRMMGSVRKMSNEFRREIDKAIAADEFREAKKAISDPLRETTADITKEFNSIRDGKVEPSGKLKPSEPGKESVVDEIRAQAGMLPAPPRLETTAAAAAMQAKVTQRVARKAKDETPAPASDAAPVASVKSRVKAAKPKAASGKATASRAKATAKASSGKTSAARDAASEKATPAKGKAAKPAAATAGGKAAAPKAAKTRAAKASGSSAHSKAPKAAEPAAKED